MMALMEKQDLMTTNPAHFTYFWCRAVFMLSVSSFALQRPAPPHPIVLVGIRDCCGANLVIPLLEKPRSRGEDSPGAGLDTFSWRMSRMHLCWLTSTVIPSTRGWVRPPPIIMFSICICRGANMGRTPGFFPKPTGSGRVEHCVGRRTRESCFSGRVRATYGLNVSFVVWSVKACV